VIARLLLFAASVAAVGGLATASAFAAPANADVDVLTTTSSNWAGYAVAAPAAPGSPFTNVSGAWVQPAALCMPGSPTFSAFWVGLGGDGPTSQALEQVGTQANCAANGRVTYSLFYELVPAPPVTITLPLKAGDGVAASVAVSGKRVSIRITNVTQKKRTFAKLFTMTSPAPDLSSAEWVAEAPSACTRAGRCTVLPLANFSAATFVVAKVSAGGHTGTISDPAWAPTAISLLGGGDIIGPRAFAPPQANASAIPTPLSPDGSSFGVTWHEPER
jgi:Peptidase A4 family